MAKKLLKILKSLLITLLVLLLIGFIFEQIARFYFDNKRPDEKEFVAINGRKIHYKKLGNGPCTIIFESGLGGDHLHWQDIQKKLLKKYTTIAYDKAGILWSDPSQDISLKRYSDDLETLLKQTNCPKPYILVGHSFGGITQRLFIQKNNKDLAGIVFVDVSHPKQLEKSSEALRNSVQPPPRKFLSFLNEIGLIRILYSSTAFTAAVPKEHWFNQNVKNYFYRIFDGMMTELENDDKLMKEASEINNFASIPLTIITAKYPVGVEGARDKKLEKEYLGIHNALQTDLLKLSTNSNQVFASKSGHYITLQEPDLICNEIEKLAPR
ncbi:alpha/beta fold hydrolase [Flavobacterium sp. DG2-3]|uniref:alpha/beta fold hydrolase n=1 Tax=Flavobacterium sp. DG2-3 TaxID=3068317 RepID=UPI00273E21CA|nr:alpha/beta hydrolase [Flavobacterium sp. DG2-3]MDP5198848.1 alpha/beta hydrolase [Flavobacterium sp. DG2-3]